MSKLRTIADIQNYLDNEVGWRIQEIDNLKKMIPNANSIQTRTLLRAGIPILYSHWEGFVKKSSEAYLNFVTNQGLSYNELKSCFIIFGLKKEIEQLTDTKASIKNIRVTDFLLKELNNKAKLFYKGIINTQSNLNSALFEEIITSIGIDAIPYKVKYKLIDEDLLKRRNQIAHGEYLNIDIKGYRKLSKNVIDLIRHYKTDIENSISLESYKSK